MSETDTPISQEYEPIKLKGIVDIVFLLDATGSMQPCIDAVKSNIHNFVTTLTSPDANGGVIIQDWRASICCYRDFTYEPKFGKEALRITPFTNDVNELYRQLDDIKAEGGGDEPESLLDALYEVINRGKTEKGAPAESDKWRSASGCARCIVAFTDASYHPTLEVVPGAGLQDVMDLIMQERIRLSFFAPAMACHFELAEADRCVYEAVQVAEGSTPAKALLDFVQDKKNFENTMMLLAKSISMSSTDIDPL